MYFIDAKYESAAITEEEAAAIKGISLNGVRRSGDVVGGGFGISSHGRYAAAIRGIYLNGVRRRGDVVGSGFGISSHGRYGGVYYGKN